MSRPCRIEFLEVVDSTQRVAQAYVLSGDTRWDAVCAFHQTAGRGRQGADWHDTPSQSLLVSLILRQVPQHIPAHLVGVAVAIASALMLEGHFPQLRRVGLKFPNDLVLQGRKVGGVLVERVQEVLITGVGINLWQATFPPEIANTAISVRQVLENLTPPSPLSYEERGEAGVSPSPFVGEKGQGVEGFSDLTPPSPLSASREGGEPSSPSPFTERGLGGEVKLAASIADELHLRAQFIQTLWDTLYHLLTLTPDEWYRLWQRRDVTLGRAYRALDLPSQPIGTAIEVDPNFHLCLRLPDGSMHTTLHATSVSSV